MRRCGLGGRKPGKTRFDAKVNGAYHTCDDPFRCGLAELETVPRGSKFRPGDRIQWNSQGFTRTGEVWERAPGARYWVVPDTRLPADPPRSLPNPHESELQPCE